MGAKIKTQKKSLGLQTKPQKIPGPKFNPKKSQFPNHKNFQRNYAARIHRNYHKSSDYLEYPQKSLLKSSYPKKYLPKFSYLKKSRNWKVQTPKNPLIIPVVWSFLSIWSPPPPGCKITVISDFVLKSSFCVSKSFMCRSCKFRGSDRLLCRLIHLTLFFCFPFNNLMNNNLLFIRHKVAFKYMI